MQNYFYAMLDRLLKKKNKRFLEKKNLRKKQANNIKAFSYEGKTKPQWQ